MERQRRKVQKLRHDSDVKDLSNSSTSTFEDEDVNTSINEEDVEEECLEEGECEEESECEEEDECEGGEIEEDDVEDDSTIQQSDGKNKDQIFSNISPNPCSDISRKIDENNFQHQVDNKSIKDNSSNLTNSRNITVNENEKNELGNINNSLESSNDELESDDLNANLNEKQKLAVDWMVTRECEDPNGGIIAVDMGTINQKVLMILNLILRSGISNRGDIHSAGDSDDIDETTLNFTGHTLIICTKATLNEWSKSLMDDSFPSNLKVCVHYGRNRDVSPQRLSQYDIVLTTTTLITIGYRTKNDNPLFQVKWNRIILDDALSVRNYQLQSSKAICHLSSNCHWALAGSKFVDDNDDATFSMIKFINYKPLNNSDQWKKWLEKNSNVTARQKLRHLYYIDKIV
ncbi:transcription termination factor 2-like [Daktulosphaira vitifoliae]|uniref:transcription termination factor 2-like n=1 Tax=Daktulosphaira vitifoliae TaxID=58002 RepID=UPI0021AA7365|nr:transcription termination factor 2-like [Daktulosphaira vitifoliae]